MTKYIIVLILLLPIAVHAQKKIDLKKKYTGTYEGTIPGYRIESDDELMFVGPADIEITIGKNQVEVSVGNHVMYGTFEVMFEAKLYYLLDVRIEGQIATERIMVYKRGKRLSRDGMFPQPVTELNKVKKKKKKD